VGAVFGLLYWLTGNLLIDRNNRAKAHGTIAQVVKHIQKRNISVWMFPEGTRSRGRGLLPFKTGRSTQPSPLACRLFRFVSLVRRIKSILTA
jgi:1-acyl-sn-glycerol-3-phosphate acyltransferase